VTPRNPGAAKQKDPQITQITQISFYRVDVLCYDSVIVEIKALGKLGEVEAAEVLNYFKAGQHKKGLRINFGTISLRHRRFVWCNPRRQDRDPSKINLRNLCNLRIFYILKAARLESVRSADDLEVNQTKVPFLTD
jgi:PD-(D/E)XK nuclease superfamily